MNKKDYDFRNETGTWQTGRTQPPKRYGGLVAFLLVLVILLSGISTALSIMNLKLYRTLNQVKESAPVTFSRSAESTQSAQGSQTAEDTHQDIQVLQENLGITGTAIPQVYQRYYKLPSGIYVSRVAEGSEAQEKGMVAGDIILSADGNALPDAQSLERWADGLEAGDAVALILYRSGSQYEMSLCWGMFE